MKSFVELIKSIVYAGTLLIAFGFLMNLFFKCTLIGRLCWEIMRSIFLVFKVTFKAARSTFKFGITQAKKINKYIEKKSKSKAKPKRDSKGRTEDTDIEEENVNPVFE